jgi:ClpX C4-type zinc finger/Glyoxalase superfamily protein
MRDFRDAKTMAHALRDALKLKAVETTHSECLELIAKAFGFENWNILSAKIEAAESREPGGRALPLAGAYDPVVKNTVSCSFCGKTQHEIETLIAGPPPLFICNECVGISSDVLADQEILSLLKADEERANQSSPAAFAYLCGKSTEELALHVERGKKGAGHWRLGLQHIKRILAVRDGAVLAERDVPGNVLASPGYAFLKNKMTEDLLALQQHAERELKRYEDVERIAATVLAEREQTSSQN